jgi:hypothetical protein
MVGRGRCPLFRREGATPIEFDFFRPSPQTSNRNAMLALCQGERDRLSETLAEIRVRRARPLTQDNQEFPGLSRLKSAAADRSSSPARQLLPSTLILVCVANSIARAGVVETLVHSTMNAGLSPEIENTGAKRGAWAWAKARASVNSATAKQKRMARFMKVTSISRTFLGVVLFEPILRALTKSSQFPVNR